jgi:hypothetical protein
MAAFDEKTLLISGIRDNFEEAKKEILDIVAATSGISLDQIPYLEDLVDVSTPESEELDAQLKAADIAIMKTGSQLSISFKDPDLMARLKSVLESNGYSVSGNEPIVRLSEEQISETAVLGLNR